MQPHNMENWQTPQRQSLAAILIIFIKTAWDLLKQFGIFLIIMLFQKPKHEEGEFYRLMIFLSFLVLSVIVTLLKYWFYKFNDFYLLLIFKFSC